MPEKEPYHIYFDSENRQLVRITTLRGLVTHFTVQLETRIGDQWLPVVRCDTAHG